MASALLLFLMGLACSKAGAGPEDIESLREFRSQARAYDGAPPVIPHEVTSDVFRRCLYCHETGRTIGEMNAPKTPHPELKNCLQCHVEPMGDDTFVANDFIPYRITGSLPGNNPAGPPRINHRLQLRENCAACHLGERAAPAIRPRHGNRPNCTQCHVHTEVVEDFPGD